MGPRECLQGRKLAPMSKYGMNLDYTCIDEHIDDHHGHHAVCYFSLRNLADAEGGYRDLDKSPHEWFDAMGAARSHCTRFMAHYNTADLAMPTSAVRNRAMAAVVDAVGAPHWIGANNPQGKVVDWLHTGANGVGHFSHNAHMNFSKWHTSQPDDADGPKHLEECVIMGPGGKWHDFACEPKNPKKRNDAATGNPSTVGPEMVFKDGKVKMHRIYPMCQVVLHGTTAKEVAVGWLEPEDVVHHNLNGQTGEGWEYASNIQALEWHTEMWDRHFDIDEDDDEVELTEEEEQELIDEEYSHLFEEDSTGDEMKDEDL